jgi:TetR/AcrR family transcriptional repressor of mexJK operon
MFLTQGYGPVTMAAIAAELGGSKGTLYGYFQNKEELFDAFMTMAGETVFEPLQSEFNLADGPVAALRTFGLNYLKLLLNPDIIAIIRLVVSESLRSPELAEIFFRVGPRRVSDRFDSLFQHLRFVGFLKADDARAPLEFKALCEAGLYEPYLLGGREPPTHKEMVEAVESAIQTIQVRYGEVSSGDAWGVTRR